ncbi:helix-turn-helix domain-containing protein [Paenibacillus sp. WQ 127069]|uniref:Helix-turn-helix domain-containing protein n=1 Tax=Paenibacillus baimaensis TaxID=2982185 RepID=A0ABT2U7Z4_9BACL|nr:helix-turn-helix transcriptional regulator [Paenibacillus sp. WQ 127069]MCU6790728.1 helix-turn-helix domain-containing protein [Paenibacillus sp. WQ 127069]
MNIISENIKRLRKLHNLNQTEFANSIGVSQGSLSDIESGKSNPSVDTIVSIFSRYSCSLEWLLTGKEANQRAEKLEDEHKFNILEKDLINTFRQLDTDNQIETIEIMKLKLRHKWSL